LNFACSDRGNEELLPQHTAENIFTPVPSFVGMTKVRVALKEAATVKESVYSILLKKRPLCHFDEGEIYSSEFTANDYLLYDNN
jgi:hypothetical protein